MKLALLDVSHWHVPLYVPALLRETVNVVAVSDRDPQARGRIASQLGARAYPDAATLMASEALDFAFVFSRHCDMLETGLALVDRGVPFCIEKPGGMSATQVRRLHAAARERALFVAVPLVQRVGPLLAAIRRLVDDEGAVFTHSSWRFFAGPPGRYTTAGNGWMLDPAQSGGGCLINLAPHFIDLVHRLNGPSVGPIASRLSNRLHAAPVEDYAMLSMASADGSSGLVETGYCFPSHAQKREFSFSVVSATHYVRSCDQGIAIYRAAESDTEVRLMELDPDPLYAQFVHRLLDDVRAGRPAPAGLADLEAVMDVVDAARDGRLPPPD